MRFLFGAGLLILGGAAILSARRRKSYTTPVLQDGELNRVWITNANGKREKAHLPLGYDTPLCHPDRASSWHYLGELRGRYRDISI